jgi:hypothetical protein
MTDDARTQAEKFKDMAREVEADANEDAFVKAARKVATAPMEKTDQSSKGRP